MIVCKHKNEKIIKDNCATLSVFKYAKRLHHVREYGSILARQEVDKVASICTQPLKCLFYMLGCGFGKNSLTRNTIYVMVALSLTKLVKNNAEANEC